MVLINLFFVPCIALVLFYRRRREAPAFSPSLLLRYAVFTVCNLPLTQILVVLIRRLGRYEIPVDAVFYTLLASLTAFLMPYMWEFCRKYIRFRLHMGVDE